MHLVQLRYAESMPATLETRQPAEQAHYLSLLFLIRLRKRRLPCSNATVLEVLHVLPRERSSLGAYSVGQPNRIA